MPWTWKQNTGEMFGPDGKVFACGYAGKGAGLNNSDMQMVKSIGPLPCGWYTISPLEPSHGHLGTNVSFLAPDNPNSYTMFGRGGFYLHGRKGPQDMDASEGCIILDKGARLAVINSKDKRLHVISGKENTT